MQRQINQFSRLIKFIRVNKRISQRRVSKRLGYTSAQFISNIERGIADLPIDKLMPLSRALDVPFKQLSESYIRAETQKIRALIQDAKRREK